MRFKVLVNNEESLVIYSWKQPEIPLARKLLIMAMITCGHDFFVVGIGENIGEVIRYVLRVTRKCNCSGLGLCLKETDIALNGDLSSLHKLFQRRRNLLKRYLTIASIQCISIAKIPWIFNSITDVWL